LDYSGTGLNSGSKVVLAAYGEQKRVLQNEAPSLFNDLNEFVNPQLPMPGVICLSAKSFKDYFTAKEEMKLLNFQLIEKLDLFKGIALIVVCDDSAFTAATMNNYLWVTYTRCNPSHDIYGIDVHVDNKHWGCKGPLVIDARIKPHHAPPVEKDPIVEQKINRLFEKGGSLYSIA
jgi:4-hydroxy-3-polyprenylbenzoate decarboxylase